MAAKRRKKRKSVTGYSPRSSADERQQGEARNYCRMPRVRPRVFASGVNNDRQRLILVSDKKWVNGTRLHYYFFTNSEWRGTPTQRQVVRDAFEVWKDVGIGLEFVEVNSVAEAEIRIGFQSGDGAWSYLGRDILDQGQSDRTMNFGWNINNDIDTAIHEIGHTLGFPHEHQNPNSGIEWNEEAVYAALAAPPNNWDRETTHWNIIRKLSQSDVEGSDWDPDSVMHYPFEAGLINKPEIYQNQDLMPAGGLSESDKAWAQRFYPSLNNNDYQTLVPYRSVQATIEPGEQLNFYVRPDATRWYNFMTFGNSDTVMVLFEEVDGQPRFRAADDDSGEDRNAFFEERLFAGRIYILRVRLYWQHRRGDFGVMMW